MSVFLVVVMAFSTVAVVLVAAPATAQTHQVTIAIEGPEEVLAGQSATYILTAHNNGTAEGFNLAMWVDLPVGVSVTGSSAGMPEAYPALTLPAGAVPEGFVRWVWEDVSDLPDSGTNRLSFDVSVAQPDPGTGETDNIAVHPVGSTFAVHAHAALSGNPRFLPVFPGATGMGTPAAIEATELAGPETMLTDVIALEITKVEPSPESELIRGVHDAVTTYTIEVTNTSEGPMEDVVITDYLPAALEYLACADVDNSSDVEYPGAPPLGGSTLSGCMDAAEVETIIATAALVSERGLSLDRVYTRVQWNIGDLGPGQTYTLTYAAAIPLFENTMTWDNDDATAPSVTSGDQAANLDNNNGPSTRHGHVDAPADGVGWTNVVVAVGQYAGVVRTGADRTTEAQATEVVDAMDVAIVKSNSRAGSETFVAGQTVDFTLELRVSEYMVADSVVITDTLPNGLCPLVPATAVISVDPGVTLPAQCDESAPVDGAQVASVHAHEDGTFSLVLELDGELDPLAEHTVTYTALMRDAYEVDDRYGSTTSGDAFVNEVSFTADTTGIPEVMSLDDEVFETWRVTDDSSSPLDTQLTTISKLVMEREGVQPDLAPGINPCTEGSFTTTEAFDFRFGDTVCFELTVNIPSGIDVRNGVVTDYLPSPISYRGHEVVEGEALGVDFDTAFLDEFSGLRWNLGTPRPDGKDDLYTPAGSTIVIHLWGVFIESADGVESDKAQNLMKYRQQNVDGELHFVRAAADAYFEPGIALTKGVLEVEDNNGDSDAQRPAEHGERLSDGTQFNSDRDGIRVRDGELVTFRVDVLPTSYDVFDIEVWDLLPAGVVPADLEYISDGGHAFAPDDEGYPAGLDSDQTVIVWTGVDTDATGATLTYDVRVNPGVFSLGWAISNVAHVISYTADINTNDDPGASTYLPCESLDSTRGGEETCTTDGTYTADDSAVLMHIPTVAKNITTELNETNNNAASQVTPGEVAYYTFSVTIPAHSSVKDGVLRDTFAVPSAWSVMADETVITWPDGTTETPVGAGSVTWDGQMFTYTPAQLRLGFPEGFYTNTTDQDQTFAVSIAAFVNPGSSWNHSATTARNNTVRFTSDGVDPIQESVSAYLIEPRPSIDKSATPTQVSGDQEVTYTVEVSNASGRPTLWEAGVVDCLPAGLTHISGDTGGLGSLAVSTAPTTPCADGETRIVWNGFDIDGGDSHTMTYTVSVDPDAAGLMVYENVATLTGQSVPEGSESGEAREYSVTDDASVQVIPPLIDKSVAQDQAVIGEEVDYTITVELPRDINIYDAAIRDHVTAGALDIDLSSVTVSCEDADEQPCLSGVLSNLTPLAAAGGVQDWYLGDITAAAVDRYVTLSYTAVVVDAAVNSSAMSVLNTASLVWNVADEDGPVPTESGYDTDQSVSDHAQLPVVEPELEVFKYIGGLLVDRSEALDATFTYTIEVYNTGDARAHDAVVVDVVPEGVVVDVSTISDDGALTDADPVMGGGTITWSLTEVGAGEGAILSYEAAFAPSTELDSSWLENVVTVEEYFSHDDSDGYDGDHRRQYDPVDAERRVQPLFPAIAVTKAATDGATAYIGQPHTFTIHVTNTGNGTAHDLEVVDELPEGWQYVAHSTTFSAGTATEPAVSGPTLTWSTGLPLLDADGSVTVTYQAVPDATWDWDEDNTGATYAHVNEVTVSADDAQGNPENADGPYEDDDDASVYIHRADLSLSKQIEPVDEVTQVVAGESLTYVLQVTNDGPDGAVGPIVITDELPDDVTYVGFDGAPWTAAYDETAHTVTLTHAGGLPVGDTLTVRVIVDVDDALEEDTEVSNSACITSVSTFDATTDDWCDEVTEDSIRLADVEIVKTSLSDEWAAGTEIDWLLTITNHGPSVAAAPITVTDVLPSQSLNPEVTDTDAACTFADVEGSTVMTCEWDEESHLEVGESFSITLTHTIDSATPAGTVITNAAEASSPTTDPDPTNNEDEDATGGADAIVDLSLVKSIVTPGAEPGAGLPAGETGRYRVDVANAGPSDALGVVVTDTLPVGLTYAGNLTSESDLWICEVDDTDTLVVECEYTAAGGRLSALATTWFEFDVDIASDVVGEITNTATVSSDTEDEDPTNNTDEVTEEATTIAALVITKTHDATVEYQPGDLVEFVIEVTNAGPADALDVVVTDTLPGHVTYVHSDNNDGWDCAAVAGAIECELDGPLVADSSVSLSIWATIQPTAFNGADSTVVALTNAVALTTTTPGSDPEDLEDTSTVDVVTVDLTVTKQANVQVTYADALVMYTIAVHNEGLGTARADTVAITDLVPAQTSVVTASGTGWSCDTADPVTCDYAPEILTGGSSAPLYLTVRVDADVAVDSITNLVSVESPDEHPTFVDDGNEDSEVVLVRHIELESYALCRADAPWWGYSIDGRNIDDGYDVRIQWFAADADGQPTGDAIADYLLDTRTTGGVLSGELLWPGASVDENGVGVAWPGFRPVVHGETPTFAAMIEDPTLPEHALRAGAVVVVTIHTEQSVVVSDQVALPECEVNRDAVLAIDKTSSHDRADRGTQVEYTLTVTNVGYGATNDVVVTDPIDERVRVVSVVASAPVSDQIAPWGSCEVTGRNDAGYGGLVTCVLDGWLGYGQAAPDILVTVAFDAEGQLGDFTNTATVEWTDPYAEDPEVHSDADSATVTVALSPTELLALTGVSVSTAIAIALLLLALGSAAWWLSRRLPGLQ